MCTVSWSGQPDGYTLIFNRDESRSRREGLPPETGKISSTHYICPSDPEGGGTWLLVNEHGLSIGLLNYYEAQVNYRPENRESRGQLPIALATCQKRKEVEKALLKTDLSSYPPFHLLAVDRTAAASLFTWDGNETVIAYPKRKDLPITTSSFETATVVGLRKERFRETVATAKEPVSAMEVFHTHKKPAPDTHAVLMTRPDAKTVSVSKIEVSESHIEMSYRARLDDTDQLEPPVIQTLICR